MKLINRIRGSIVLKTTLEIIAVLLVYSCIVSFIGYREVTEALMSQYSDGAFRTAGIAAHVVDPNRVDEYMDSGGQSEEYLSVDKTLSKICNSVRETTNEDYEEKYRRICEDLSSGELVIRNQGYIETDPHITAMIPLIGVKGEVEAILCVQRQMEELNKVRNSYVLKIFLAMIAAAVLISIGLSVRLDRSLLRPIRIMSTEASRFASENVSAGEKLTQKIHNRDEVGQLAESIDQMETQIHSYVTNLTQITAEKERISTELSLAARIQRDMLPNIFPAFPERTDFDIYASMDPAREIGGDFYNFFLIDENHLCVVIADVSGKGVPAALFMMAATIVLVDNARMGKSPAEILESANEAICATNREEMFVTVWLGILDLSTGIGGMEEIKYHSYELQMKPGSKLFVYTDGVAEASNSQDELFGTERMLEALNSEPDADPVTLLGNVKKAVDRFVGDAEQFDDLTMLCLEYKGTSP